MYGEKTFQVETVWLHSVNSECVYSLIVRYHVSKSYRYLAKQNTFSIENIAEKRDKSKGKIVKK